jgi:hypothetical protein
MVTASPGGPIIEALPALRIPDYASASNHDPGKILAN